MPKKREWTEGERGQVVALRKAGKSYKEIQQLTGIPITTSYDIVQKATTTGSVVNQPRSGRPSIFSPTVQNQIHQVIKAQPDITAKEITTKLVKKFGTRYSSSESSVRKKRVELGYTKGKGLGQDSLTADQKKQRLQYCKQHLKDQFSNVVFSDEKPWVVGKKRRSLWRKHGGARQSTRSKFSVGEVYLLVARPGSEFGLGDSHHNITLTHWINIFYLLQMPTCRKGGASNKTVTQLIHPS
jgi:transposase